MEESGILQESVATREFAKSVKDWKVYLLIHAKLASWISTDVLPLSLARITQRTFSISNITEESTNTYSTYSRFVTIRV